MPESRMAVGPSSLTSGRPNSVSPNAYTAARWTRRHVRGSLKGTHLKRVGDVLKLAMVQVRSHSRQRQSVVALMTLARVSMALPVQKGHAAGRATAPANCESAMMLFRSPNVRNPKTMRGLTTQEDDRQPQPQAAGHNGSGRDRALRGLPFVFHTACDPSRPSLIGRACVNPVGSRHLSVHDTWWRLLESAAVQE